MADIELVIKISKSDYRCIKEIPLSSMFGFDNWKLIAQAIANGIPLPKGHGRLIDANRLKTHFVGTEQGTDLEVYLGSTIIDAPTIIEADIESEES